MTIFAAKSINYAVPSDNSIDKYFDSLDKALAFIQSELIRVKAEDITQRDEYTFDYLSHYGNYPCARKVIIINVE